MKVMIVVTHLLGTGHLARALVLARSFEASGHKVLLMSGGMPAPQLDAGELALVQMPPLRSDGVNFSRLLDDQGAQVAPGFLHLRAQMLCRYLRDFDPAVLITELYPFGRRVLRDEFQALLDDAWAMPKRPLICASIRDILAPPSKPSKAQATDQIIKTRYDAVLVHSDHDIMPLEVSWPVSEMLGEKLIYTGFVAPDPAEDHPSGAGNREILVTAGGGDVGVPVFRAAIDAAAADPGLAWRLLVGGQNAQAQIAAFRSEATANVRVEATRRDFRQMLPLAKAAVSMCGYNTALDLLQSGTPAVLVPFDAGNEREQGLRAQRLKQLDGIEVVMSKELTGATLLKALQAVMAAPQRAPRRAGMNGAKNTVRAVEDLKATRT
jgi:predicted glycosyltransferase